MPILITGDLHFTSNPRDLHRYDIVDVIHNIIDEYDVTTLLVLGDITEAKDKHNAWLTNVVADHFKSLASFVNIVILQGNHDAIDVECPFFFFLRLLRAKYNIRWVTDPTSMQLDELWDCVLLPHTTDHKTRWSFLSGLGKKPDFIFAHNTFKGTTSESGIELDGIPTSVFPKGVPVISGDIHKPQKVGPVTYVGSPYLVDFGDDFEPRMLLINDDGDVKSLACPGIQKRVVNIYDALSEDVTVEGVANDGDIVKAKVHLTCEEFTSWDDITRRVKQWGIDNGFNIHTVQAVVDAPDSSSRRSKEKNVSVRYTDADLIKRHAKLQKYGSEVIKTGLKFLE